MAITNTKDSINASILINIIHGNAYNRLGNEVDDMLLARDTWKWVCWVEEGEGEEMGLFV